MKKTKQITSLVLASSILTQSCISVSPLDELDESTENNKTNLTSIILDFKNIDFDDNVEQYMLDVGKIANLLLSSEKEAVKFSNNPIKYLKDHNISSEININSPEIKYLIALGDKDIIKAKENGDIKLFLKLCDEKGLFKEIITLHNKEINSYVNSILNNDDFCDYFLKDKTHKMMKIPINNDTSDEKLACLVPIAVFVVLVVAVLFGVAVGMAVVASTAVSVKGGRVAEMGNDAERLWAHNNTKNSFSSKKYDFIDSVIDEVIKRDIDNRVDINKLKSFLQENM